MSYLTTLQKPVPVVPDLSIVNGISQGDAETYQVHPANIIIQVSEPKTACKFQEEDDRQQQREDDKQKQKQRRMDKEHNKRMQESGLAYWLRRILVGKDEYEEEQEQKNHKLLNCIKKEVRRHLSEFIGSFFIVVFIAGIQVNQDSNSEGGVANVDKGLVAGFLLAGLIYCFGNVSGAHFNPCVTLAFALRGSFNFFRTISYITAQFAGAVAGAGVLYSIFGTANGLGTTIPVPPLEPKDAFGVEILITFILITVGLTTAENAQILGATSGLAVGATFGALVLFAWNLSGSSANPWRTIGPTLVSGVGWNTYWVYIVGPVTGTLIAVLVQRILVTGIKRQDTEDVGVGEGKNGEKDED